MGFSKLLVDLFRRHDCTEHPLILLQFSIQDKHPRFECQGGQVQGALDLPVDDHLGCFEPFIGQCAGKVGRVMQYGEFHSIIVQV